MFQLRGVRTRRRLLAADAGDPGVGARKRGLDSAPRAGAGPLNEIGRVQLRTTVPLLCDPYAKNRTTGSFILVDEATGVTVGAGMINTAA
jgi:hypothetical protein